MRTLIFFCLIVSAIAVGSSLIENGDSVLLVSLAGLFVWAMLGVVRGWS